jgi:hypothetical protein
VPHSELQWRSRGVADRLTETIALLLWIDSHNGGRLSAADIATLRQARTVMVDMRHKLLVFSEGA